jgi:hypothetical protein
VDIGSGGKEKWLDFGNIFEAVSSGIYHWFGCGKEK